MNNLVIVFVGSILVVSAIAFAVSASPSVELTRETQLSVTNDVTGIVSLIPNDSIGMVQLDTAGQLSITPANLGADSLNNNMELSIGDTVTPSNNPAFTVSTLTTESVEMTFELTEQASYDGEPSDVTYVIEQNGTVQTIQPGESTTIAVQPGETVAISIDISTVGTQTNLDTNLNITGSTL